MDDGSSTNFGENEETVFHQNTDETAIVENKENEAPKKRGRPAKIANAHRLQKKSRKTTLNKSRKTTLVAVRKSNR